MKSNSSSLFSYSPQCSPVTKNAPTAIPEDAITSSREKDGRLARHSSADYERIRVVGKGSFGMAVLYRRKEDDSFVILKEINLHELGPSERQMSLNEVRLLSRLDHPHIIAFYDSFEEEGVLMIEMEYADGGTLAQFLARQTELLAEAVVMDMFEQMASAVSYLHDNNILHRDLKTANIFLTSEMMVKVGDFGVSKKMGTETKFQGAQTILGTPYYLSPEMCEGRPYNERSDMWALGCCLYEMCALRKAFDADNLPTLIHKIINSEYEPLNGPYSQDVRLLVRELLRTDAEQRPTAARVLEQVRRFRSSLAAPKLAMASKTLLKAKAAKTSTGDGDSNYSALYGFDVLNVTLSAVQEFPARLQIRQVSASATHQLLLTVDGRVYSWGDNRFGQLGHGDRRKRLVPTHVDALKSKGISRVAAGKNFSLFCGGRGIVLAAGHRQLVGTGPISEDQMKPKIVDALLKEDIVDISCGDEHATALSEAGAVFVWGRNENGQLGTGDTKDVFVPIRIQIPTRQLINSVACGPNSTVLVTNSGTVLAMGSNRMNKLNLNQRAGFFKDLKNNPQLQQQQQQHVEDVLLPTAVRPFPSRVVSASLGTGHSGVLLENGHVHLFGQNVNGELGTGNNQPVCYGCTRPVKALLAKACVHLICGDGFTMVGTLDNEIYFWGLRGGGGGSGDGAEEVSIETVLEEGSGKVYKMARTREGWQLSASVRTNVTILQPMLVLRLDICRAGSAGLNTGSASASRPLIGLTGLVCSGKRVFCVVDVAKEAASRETTADASKKAPAGAGQRRRRRRSAPDALSVKSMETWIKAELDSAEHIPLGQCDSDVVAGHSSTMLLKSERRLREEIQLLRAQLQEQSSTFRGHEKQMVQLQAKLAELQNLLRRQQTLLALPPVNVPPPEYPGSDRVPPKTVLRNTFVPPCSEGRQPPSRACAIL